MQVFIQEEGGVVVGLAFLPISLLISAPVDFVYKYNAPAAQCGRKLWRDYCEGFFRRHSCAKRTLGHPLSSSSELLYRCRSLWPCSLERDPSWAYIGKGFLTKVSSLLFFALSFSFQPLRAVGGFKSMCIESTPCRSLRGCVYIYIGTGGFPLSQPAFSSN